MNCTVPPIPRRSAPIRWADPARRGRAYPGSERIAVVATGGLSHEPGGPRYFWVDEEFDRWFLDLLKKGDHETLLRECTLERMEAAARRHCRATCVDPGPRLHTRPGRRPRLRPPRPGARGRAWSSGTSWRRGRTARVARTHHLDRSVAHYEWNNASPRGSRSTRGTRWSSRPVTPPTVLLPAIHPRGRPEPRPVPGPPLTGPVRAGAQPGDVLAIDILDVQPGADWVDGHPPGRGLLPEADFSKPFLQIWDVSDRPTPAWVGVSPCPRPLPGRDGNGARRARGHSTMPPRKNGGNMDEAVDGGHHGLPARVGGRRLSASATATERRATARSA